MRLFQETHFDAAHRLLGYDGNCGKLHGHMWQVSISIETRTNELDKCGMLVDYRTIKNYFKENFDHTTILNSKDPLCGILPKFGCTVTELNGNPTAENLCIHICKHFDNILPDELIEITIHESPENSFTYYNGEL